MNQIIVVDGGLGWSFAPVGVSEKPFWELPSWECSFSQGGTCDRSLEGNRKAPQTCNCLESMMLVCPKVGKKSVP